MSDGRIGLGAGAELAYRTMLLRSRWRPAALAAALGWSAEDVEHALAELREVALVADSADDATSLRAVEPGLGLPALVTRRMRSRAAGRFSPSAVERLVVLHERTGRTGERGGGVGVDETTAAVERLATKIDEEVVFLVAEYRAGGFEFSRPVAEAVLRRGAHVRAVWSAAVLREPGAVEHGRWLAGLGCAPRVVGRVPHTSALLDGVVLVHTEDGLLRMARSRALVDRHGAMVDEQWRRSSEARALATPERSTDENHRPEAVLRLLADGLTDDAVARRLGVSVRTVRTDMASTMSTLDARSRFQAGVRAMQLGII